MKLHRLNLLVSVDFGGGFTSLSSMTLATIRASHYFPGEKSGSTVKTARLEFSELKMQAVLT